MRNGCNARRFRESSHEAAAAVSPVSSYMLRQHVLAA